MYSLLPRHNRFIICVFLGILSFSLRAQPAPATLLPTFTASYADAEISAVRILPEALVKRSGVATTAAENKALALAIRSFA
ncbi:MAG: hypothetical protein RL376_717, partial [Verrucomicrobiota bacterium]